MGKSARAVDLSTSAAHNCAMPVSKSLKKAAKGVHGDGRAGLSNKGVVAEDKRNVEMQCPYCERIFKQADRLRMHKERQHKDKMEEEGGAEPQEKKVDLATQFQLTAKGSTTAAANKLAEQQAAAKAAREARRAERFGTPIPPQTSTSAAAAAAAAAPAQKDAQPPKPETPAVVIRRPQTSTTPRNVLQEWLVKHKRLKPRFKLTEAKKADGGGFTCKLVLPDKFKPDNDVVLFNNTKYDTKEDAENAVALFDTSHDGMITKHEFKEQLEVMKTFE